MHHGSRLTRVYTFEQLKKRDKRFQILVMVFNIVCFHKGVQDNVYFRQECDMTTSNIGDRRISGFGIAARP
jgi:hypothetical protein